MSYTFSLPLALNDLFFDWLSRSETKFAIDAVIQSHAQGTKPVISVQTPSTPIQSRSATHNANDNSNSHNPGFSTPLDKQPQPQRLSSPPSPNLNSAFPMTSPPRSPQRRVLSQSQLRSPGSIHSPSSLSSNSKEFLSIRQFYFPDGIPVSPATKQRELSLINEIFQDSPSPTTASGIANPIPPLVHSLSLEDFYPLTSLVCGFSSFFTSTLFARLIQLESAGAQRVRMSTFERFFVENLQNFDPPTRLHRLLRREPRKYLIRDDFSLFANELVRRHPGLEFLAATPEFQVKYAQTVIGRIFYQINKCGSERLTLRELKSSNFMMMAALLDSEEDINKLNDYFSYEHFYVVYVKFWELDSDHNGLINCEDLLSYEEFSLTELIVNRVISGFGRKKFCEFPDQINFIDFVTFLISEVDKSSDQALDYWFNCVDLDGDGLIAPYELELFFKEQQQKIQSLSQEQISFPDICCQLLDSIKPNNDIDSATPSIKKSDLKNSKMASQFFNTLFNLNKFIQGEQRDPMKLKQMQETPQLSDWDRFAIASYYRLAEQEQMENDEIQENF